jgi:enediyne biosynthesis protein E4
LLVGNDFGMELLQGRADALYGLVLWNKGRNSFEAVSLEQSHFLVPRDARALARIQRPDNTEWIVATQSMDSIKVFQLSAGTNKLFYDPQPQDAFAEMTFENGSKRRTELSYGSGFLSQGSRRLYLPAHLLELKIYDFKGRARVIQRPL